MLSTKPFTAYVKRKSKVEASLQRLTGGTNKVAQSGYVWAVRADAPCVHGKTELLGLVEIDSGIIEFGQTVARSRSNTIHARRINGPRRAVALPRPPCQFVKLFPIAFLPIVHRTNALCCSIRLMR